MDGIVTTPTPGQRLHATLLAHGIEYDAWDSYHPLVQRDFERAARAYDADGDLRARLDALAAEVAALRRERDADDAAFAEIGDRLAILESSKENVGSWLLSLDGWRRTQEALGPFARQSEIDDCETRLARCEQLAGDAYGRDLGICDQMGDDRERLARLESRVARLEEWA